MRWEMRNVYKFSFQNLKGRDRKRNNLYIDLKEVEWEVLIGLRCLRIGFLGRLLQIQLWTSMFTKRAGNFLERNHILTAVNMKMAVFWVVAPCSLVVVY
jgi:hypothetical protein